jgi:hypothetical protein
MGSAMDAPLRPIVRFLLWDYDRLSSAYLILCALLALLIVIVPPGWLGDPMALPGLRVR